MTEKILFLVFAIPLVATALGVLVSRSPVYAAVNLVAAFFCMAGLYVLLAAHLIAFMQVLVYAGAVMVLFLCALAVAAVIGTAIWRVGDGAVASVDGAFGTVKAVGRVLFTEYLLPFEATSLLLLVAIVGAVVVAKERI
jgi:NADH-quinone oxidoreductase subunit J